MPKNSKKLRAKDVDGKKIREQYFDGIVSGFLIGAIACTVFYLFDIENFSKNIINVIILFACCSPLLLLSFFNKFCFGKILCILTEDKLYYFNAETRIKSRHSKTNGYVSYDEIKNIEYIPSTFGVSNRLSRVNISGDDFVITIWNANRGLVKQIRNKQA